MADFLRVKRYHPGLIRPKSQTAPPPPVGLPKFLKAARHSNPLLRGKALFLVFPDHPAPFTGAAPYVLWGKRTHQPAPSRGKAQFLVFPDHPAPFTGFPPEILIAKSSPFQVPRGKIIFWQIGQAPPAPSIGIAGFRPARRDLSRLPNEGAAWIGRLPGIPPPPPVDANLKIWISKPVAPWFRHNQRQTTPFFLDHGPEPKRRRVYVSTLM